MDLLSLYLTLIMGLTCLIFNDSTILRLIGVLDEYKIEKLLVKLSIAGGVLL